MMTTVPELIGLVPMAGRATRLAPLPCSKELYPVIIQQGEHGARPKVVSEFLLERMRLAGVRKAVLVIRDGKWDIPAYYNDGTALVDLHLAYVTARLPYGPPFSLDAAYPFVKDALVAMGFPDMLFSPDDAFCQLLKRQADTQADVVLGLFPLPDHLVDDLMELDAQGRVRRFFVKQRVPHLNQTWNVAVWRPRFTQFLHNYLADHLRTHGAPETEFITGHVLQAAVEAGLTVQTVTFPDGRFLDLGTPEGLERLPGFLDMGDRR
jgi:glucose-1-phosphate thymidylyltransferase